MARTNQKVATGLADECCDKNSFHSAVKAGLRDATLPVLVLLAMVTAATLAPEKCRYSAATLAPEKC